MSDDNLINRMQFALVWRFNTETHQQVVERARPIMSDAIDEILRLRAALSASDAYQKKEK